jgi:hypothetical protein
LVKAPGDLQRDSRTGPTATAAKREPQAQRPFAVVNRDTRHISTATMTGSLANPIAVGDGMLFENRNGGSVELLDDSLVVRREGKAAAARETEIAYSSISSVEFREAGIASGYIQFRTGTRKVANLSEALSNESTILFARDLNDEFIRLRDLVEKRIQGDGGRGDGAPTSGQDRLAQLERLSRLKSSGLLDEAEFQAEKARILASPTQPPRIPNGVRALTGLTAIVVIGAILVGEWASTKDETPPPKPTLPVASASQTTAVTIAPPTPVKSQAERLTDAFEAATGHRTTFTALENGDEVTTKPLRIVSLPFGEALLTSREIKDGCHACAGAIGVYYLNTSGDTVDVTGSWPTAVEGWGWGAPPSQWYLTSNFTSMPAIYASGAFMGQGITGNSATLTELTPSGPVTSDVIGTDYSDAGAIVDAERPACIVKGRIANIVRDSSFDVIVTGSVRGVDHYVKAGGKFVATSEIDWGLPCGS